MSDDPLNHSPEGNSVLEVPFTDADQREVMQREGYCIKMTPWVVQQICYEIVCNHILKNNPRVEGIPLDIHASLDQNGFYDKVKSSLFVDIAFNYDAKVVNKRPAVFVSRGDVLLDKRIMQQTMAYNVRESEKYRTTFANIGVGISCIHNELGKAEMLADFIKIPFMYFGQEIKRNYGFREFKVGSISSPQYYGQARDNFLVTITLQIAYDDAWKVMGDDLKIKTLAKSIVDSPYTAPLRNQ